MGLKGMDNLYDQLVLYNRMDYYPMHMPGHKRNTDFMQMINPYAIDITEIEGFDNLHQADGIIKQLGCRISRLYGARKSYPIVNGSTAGILAGISAATNYGDKVLVARNCHKSVYHAIELRGLKPIYYYPPQVMEMSINGGILPDEIEAMLIKHREITLVIITSPTYEGIVSDIRAISELVHRHGARLLVDEAHGAHFGFHTGFPRSAVREGADIIIQSLHKTLPSLTQTAVLHSNVDCLNKKIQKYLTIYQSSSPSYLLLAGIDCCITLLEQQREELFTTYYQQLMDFYLNMKQLKSLRILTSDLVGRYGIYDVDISKITISVLNTNLTGHQLQQLLYNDYHIVMEMETPNYVLGMTSICDKKEGFYRLGEALTEIDASITRLERGELHEVCLSVAPVSVIPIFEAVEHESEQIPLKDSCGRISAAYVCMYPPGSPILTPGERIDEAIIHSILTVIQNDITITGLCNSKEIEVLCEDKE